MLMPKHYTPVEMEKPEELKAGVRVMHIYTNRYGTVLGAPFQVQGRGGGMAPGDWAVKAQFESGVVVVPIDFLRIAG